MRSCAKLKQTRCQNNRAPHARASRMFPLLTLSCSLFQTSVQVPSPAAGVIQELLVPDGGKVEGGTPLFTLRKGGPFRKLSSSPADVLHLFKLMSILSSVSSAAAEVSPSLVTEPVAVAPPPPPPPPATSAPAGLPSVPQVPTQAVQAQPGVFSSSWRPGAANHYLSIVARF